MTMAQRNQTSASAMDRPLPVLPEARPAGQTVTSDVIVPALQNLVGGLGAGVAVERVLSIWTPLVRDDVNFWALSTGLLVFGLATAVRAFRDEIVIMIHAWAERRNNQDYTDLLRLNEESKIENARLQSRIAQLESDSGYGIADMTIRNTAWKLLQDYYERGLPFTQEETLRREVCSRTVWNIITGFFKEAKITNRNGGVLNPRSESGNNANALSEAWLAFVKAHDRCGHSEIVSGRTVKVIPNNPKK